MVGTLPKTSLLLTRNNMVVGHFASYYELTVFFGTRVSDCGRVTVNGRQYGPQYVMEDIGPIANNHFKNKYEVLKDWSTNYLWQFLKYERYSLYRYLINH